MMSSDASVNTSRAKGRICCIAIFLAVLLSVLFTIGAVALIRLSTDIYLLKSELSQLTTYSYHNGE